MENVRWILLLVGVVVVLGIYFFSRLQDWWQSRSESVDRQRHEPGGGAADFDPLFDDPGDNSYVDAELERMDRLISEDSVAVQPDVTVELLAVAASEAQAPEPHDPEKVVTLFVLAPVGVPFRGAFLLDAMSKADLQFGDMQIFHCREKYEGKEQTLFSVANIMEPGTFDQEAGENFTTRGLVLFMQLPGPVDAIKAFDSMVRAARSLADSLEGSVCDASRSVLTNQTIAHLREGVVDYQVRQRVSRTAS